ncbi:hypothetical protein [Vasconcelosia minhoensis]|uniref:hypothetical protein n=1 Tax=Vasconcelosia minhoensis TaxID=3366354 RepID=UPI002AD31FF0|nr:hypothetical protein [Romeria gracilis]
MITNHFLNSENVLGALPHEAKEWLEGLPWAQRRYVLSLCHVMCAVPPEVQAEFLDSYTADGLISRIIHDQNTQQRVNYHLQRFRIATQLTEVVLRGYIRQFCIHSAQDAVHQLDLYLETALKLMNSAEERNTVLSYVLGFEILKILFQMTWEQQERLYRLQPNQEAFVRSYVKPVQQAHRLNGIIVPRDENHFFARRDYYVQNPELSEERLTALILATFRVNAIVELGFSVIRHVNAIQFNYDYIYQPDDNPIFD